MGRRNMDKLVVFLIVAGVSGLSFGVMWLLTKGLIWAMLILFNINWYQNFWVVFVFILIVGLIFNPKGYTGRK